MLGKFELRGVLGRGAMGTVHDGWDPGIGRRVAIKVVPVPHDRDAEADAQLQRFRQEGQAAGRLNHPNIVGVYDVGDAELDGDTVAYLAMEFVDGRSLRSLLDEGERMPLPATRRVMEDLLAGLQYSHARGVVHRDIKPDNLILTAEGQLKIADFGIARIESSNLTQVGTIMGTPSYMSPEQFTGQPVDHRTDLYSAGVVLYLLLTGEKPFTGSMSAIMHKALHVEPPAPSALSVGVPAALDAVVRRAMAKRPEDRFADAGAFLAAMRAAFDEKPAPAIGGIGAWLDEDGTVVRPVPALAPAPAPPAPTLRPARRVPVAPLAGGGILAAALLAGGAWFATRGGAPPAPAPASHVAAPPPVATLPTPAHVASAPPVAAYPAPPRVEASTLAALRDRLGMVACSAASLEPVQGGAALRLAGTAGEGAPLAAVRAAAAGAGVPVTDALVRFTGPYCSLLDLLRPVARDPQGLAVTMGDGDTLVENQPIRFRVQAPRFPAFLQVDYLEVDGSVDHLVADTKPQPPGSSESVGEAPGQGWQVGPPFGTDMLVVLAVGKPLFDRPRPDGERGGAYLAALRARIDALRAAGVPMSAAFVPVVTRARS